MKPRRPRRQAAAAPAGPVGRDAVYAAAEEGPEPFVRALYAQYVSGGPQGEPPPAGAGSALRRMLNAMIGADFRKVANGEVPTLELRPCSAAVRTAATSPWIQCHGRQTGRERGRPPRWCSPTWARRSQTLKLVREGVNWKVDDVIGADGKSVQAETIKVIEAAGG
jgi:hypothetical protein